MTTIAWDSRLVAADTQADFNGYTKRRAGPKIERGNGCAYAICGHGAWFGAWIEWYEVGANPAETPKHNAKDDLGNFIVFKADGTALLYSHEMPYPSILTAPHAFGTGREYAIGAMLAGAPADAAVRIAIMADPHTGGDVDVIDLRKLALAPTSSEEPALSGDTGCPQVEAAA